MQTTELILTLVVWLSVVVVFFYYRHRAMRAESGKTGHQETAASPPAWAKIDQAIRVKLAAEVATQHDENFQKAVAQLRASARTVKN